MGQTVVLTDDNIHQYCFPKCCHPIPGDEILAYVNDKNQIEIHSRNCMEAARLQSSFGSKILAARWNMRGETDFHATVMLRGIDRKGILRDITALLTNNFDIDIHRLSTLTQDSIFNSEIEFKVKDNKLLESVVEQLAKIDGMQQVHRI